MHMYWTVEKLEGVKLYWRRQFVISFTVFRALRCRRMFAAYRFSENGSACVRALAAGARQPWGQGGQM